MQQAVVFKVKKKRMFLLNSGYSFQQYQFLEPLLSNCQILKVDLTKIVNALFKLYVQFCFHHSFHCQVENILVKLIQHR